MCSDFQIRKLEILKSDGIKLTINQDMLPASKFADKWIGSFRVLKVNKNGTYHLVGSNSRKLDGAVNGDKLTAFHNAKLMVPDVAVTRAQQQFKSWVARFNTVPS